MPDLPTRKGKRQGLTPMPRCGGSTDGRRVHARRPQRATRQDLRVPVNRDRGLGYDPRIRPLPPAYGSGPPRLAKRREHQATRRVPMSAANCTGRSPGACSSSGPARYRCGSAAPHGTLRDHRRSRPANPARRRPPRANTALPAAAEAPQCEPQGPVDPGTECPDPQARGNPVPIAFPGDDPAEQLGTAG